MRALRIAGLMLLVALAGALWAQAGEPATGQDEAAKLIAELKGEGEAVTRSAAEWEAAHAKALDALLPALGGDNLDERGEAARACERICWRASRPGADAERAAAVKAILARLKPELPRPALTVLLARLENIGREEVVDAVAKFLDFKDTDLPSVREAARCALLKNPSPKAVDALRAAFARADNAEWRVGLINALGERRDKAAVAALITLVKAENQDVRLAAIEALARIGDKAAAGVLAGASRGAPPRVWRIAIVSYLLLADRLVEANDKASALKLYQNLLGADDYVKCGALIGVGRAGGPAELSVIFEAMASQDAETRGAARSALDMMPADAVKTAIDEKLKTVGPEVKVVLLKLLADRGERSTVATFIASAADADEAVRIAACEGMGTVGDASAVPTLIAALGKAKDKELDAVKAALVRIPGKGATDALVKAMDGADVALRAEVLRTLSARKDEAALPALLKAAEDAEAAIRSEAFKAIGNFAGGEAIGPLVALLVKAAEDKDRGAAERAIVVVCGRVDDAEKRSAPILGALPKAEGPAKAALLRVLGKIGGTGALAAVRSAVKDASAEVKDAALRALADWPDASPAADLLEIARSADNLAQHVLALRGCLRVAGLPNGLAPDEALKIYADAMKVAKRIDEKKQVLGAIGEVHSLAALKLVEPYLGDLEDNDLKAEAVMATVKIASSIIGANSDEAKAALRKVLASDAGDAVKKQAQDALSQVEKLEDYITAWEVAGPYTKAGKDGPGLHSEVFPPETPDAKGVAWKIIPPGGGEKEFYPFYMDLNKQFNAKENAVAYLRTNVWSPEEQKVQLEFGSDDGAKLWINGQLVVNADQPRSFEVAKDKVAATLKKGWNPMLVKVWNGSGHWGAATRFRKPDGSHRDGLRAEIKPE